jgi:hypothetical protein
MRTLNIFVSGTIEDQRAERNTVGAALNRCASTRRARKRSTRPNAARATSA